MGYKTKRVLAVSLLTLTAISFGFALLGFGCNKPFTWVDWLIFGAQIEAGISAFIVVALAIIFGFAWATGCDEDENYFSFVKDVVSDFFD